MEWKGRYRERKKRGKERKEKHGYRKVDEGKTKEKCKGRNKREKTEKEIARQNT